MKTNKQTAAAFIAGKPAKGSNFYTDGETVTSCRTMIGRRINGVILLADRYDCYSIYGYFYGRTATTERQKSHIKTAASRAGYDYFIVPDINAASPEEHLKNWQFLYDQASAAQKKARNARKFEYIAMYQLQAARMQEEAENYFNMFCK